MEKEKLDEELLRLEISNKALKKGSDLQRLDISTEWCVNKLFPKQSIITFAGMGGIGKTWLMLQLANSVSKGQPFLGLETQKMPVVYIDFENSLPVLVERIKKIGITEVHFWHITHEIRPPRLDSKDWYLYKFLPQGSLLIFDTLRASHNKDENDSKEMASVMSKLKELRDEGFTIILLHHTPKADARIYKGSTAISDLSDHVLSLHRVRKGNYEEIEEDDIEDYCYRLGTKGKTRYEPFHIFLDFDPERGFVIAPDPDEEAMKELHSLIVELKESTGEPPIQSRILDKAKEELDLSYSKTRKLLGKGEGKYWNSTKIPEKKNAKVFEPISVCQFVNTIYSRQTNKLSDEANQFVNDTLTENASKNLENIEFVSLLEDVQQSNKQDKCIPCIRLASCMMTEGQKQLCGGPFES